MNLSLRFNLFYLFLLGALCTQAQDKSFGLRTGLETNYTGINALLNGEMKIKNHTIEVGINYNMSDGFSNSLVIGQGISYHYSIADRKKWSTSVGLEYRRQKPIKIVNVQQIMYAMGVRYQFTDHFSANSKLGYGVAVERALSAQSFSQSNIITGFFQVGCGYTL